MDKNVVQMLAVTALLDSMCGGPYTGMITEFTSRPKRIIETIGCSVCGATRVTLYKTEEGRICSKCRKEKKYNDSRGKEEVQGL